MGRKLWFDRTVSRRLMDVLLDTAAGELVTRAQSDGPDGQPLFDVQLRRDTKGTNPVSWASLYCGLTSILDLQERGGKIRLRAHGTHRERGGFDDAWNSYRHPEDFDRVWPDVFGYLDRVLPLVDDRWKGKEGRVHAGISSGTSDAYRVINREVSPAFSDQKTKDRLTAQWWKPLAASLLGQRQAPAWWPKGTKPGTSPDFLAVDIGGRLAVIEAKHHSATGMIAKVPLQVGFYAAMYCALFQEDVGAVGALQSMLDDRIKLGLTRTGVLHLARRGEVVPVVAIGPGQPSTEARNRLWAVAAATAGALGDGVDPLEVWYLDERGRITEVERHEDHLARTGVV